MRKRCPRCPECGGRLPMPEGGLGAKYQELREANFMTREGVALRLGKSVTWLTRLEADAGGGTAGDPDTEALMRLYGTTLEAVVAAWKAEQEGSGG